MNDMEQDYWQKQEPEHPLFPDIEWNKPEQRSRAGKLLIVGGSASGFMAVVRAYQTASELGAGEVKVVIPDVLKTKLPPDFREGIFLPSNHSGGLSKDGIGDLTAAAEWADNVLLVGDFGQNSETAILLEQLLPGNEKWLGIARDAVGLLTNSGEDLVNNDKHILIMSFAQTQKLFSTVYYPKILTFSMNLSNLVEALHKFTVTYPACIVTFHQNQIIAARDGQVVSQKLSSANDLIDGSIAVRAVTYLLWTPNQPLEAIVSSWLTPNGKV
jgi:NAD(P)H-hydrate repair Nnr-like enzyme with NAD(P)H-hydrate dehydratase domain